MQPRKLMDITNVTDSGVVQAPPPSPSPSVTRAESIDINVPQAADETEAPGTQDVSAPAENFTALTTLHFTSCAGSPAVAKAASDDTSTGKCIC
jgi:hypothetical protein